MPGQVIKQFTQAEDKIIPLKGRLFFLVNAFDYAWSQESKYVRADLRVIKRVYE